MTAAIETDDLTRSFPSGVALDGLTLSVQPGEVLALLGPNGAGKTTTVRLLNGILTPDRGRATVLGLDPAVDGDEVRRRTGVLTEHAGLDERLTARENLELTGADARASTARGRRGARRAARALRHGRPGRLTVQGTSTGQRKRLALARALLHDPEVLFLDEPTSGLDPAATRDVIDLIGALATEHGRTVVLCTHFLGEAGGWPTAWRCCTAGCCTPSAGPRRSRRSCGRASTPSSTSAAPIDAATRRRPPGQLAGVLAVAPRADGRGRARSTDATTCPLVVRLLVDRGVPVYGARRRRPVARGRVLRRRGPHRRRRGPRPAGPPPSELLGGAVGGRGSDVDEPSRAGR